MALMLINFVCLMTSSLMKRDTWTARPLLALHTSAGWGGGGLLTGGPNLEEKALSQGNLTRQYVQTQTFNILYFR